MARYDRPYDYGLRGYQETVRPRRRIRARRYGQEQPRDFYGQARYDLEYERGYDRGFSVRGEWRPVAPRVTARYNLDYVREQHPGRTHVNYHPYGGAPEVPVGDAREYQRPYQTLAGTRTWRGGDRPIGWERGGRYEQTGPAWHEGARRGYDRWY